MSKRDKLLSVVCGALVVLNLIALAYKIGYRMAERDFYQETEQEEVAQPKEQSADVLCGKLNGDDTVASGYASLEAYEQSEDYAEDFENEKIEAALLAKSHKLTDVTVSYYCTEKYKHICGTGTGVTASGRKVTAGVSCAVDTSVIPLGATVLVDYGDGDLQYYVADDTGSAINGKHIDIAVAQHSEALERGLRKATVYWCMEVPYREQISE